MPISEILAKAWAALTKWLAAGVASLFLLSYLALRFGWPDLVSPDLKQGLVTAALIVFVLSIALQLVDIYGQVRGLRSDVSAVLRSASWQLVPLQDCQAELAAALREVAHRKPVLLHHLGLNMDHAWPRMLRHISELGRVKDLTIHLVMISPQLPDGAWAVSETELRRWRRAAEDSLALIKGDLKDLRPQLPANKSRLRVEIRGYRDFPLIHGFAMVEPRKLRCFTYCRWTPKGQMDWGEDRYRKILGEPLDPSLADMAGVFDTAFARLWESGRQEVLLTYDSAQPTGRSKPSEREL